MERITAKEVTSMMEAVAAVYEKKGDCVDKKEKGAHNCAKKVCHEESMVKVSASLDNTLFPMRTVLSHTTMFSLSMVL